jgi:YHS domain-containing protein
MNTESRLTSRPAIIAYAAIAVVVAVFVGALYVAPLLGTKRQFADYNVDAANVAIHGYDTVAYFTEGKPTKGKGEFEQTWQDARWRFASATNSELFKANPERYAPQFGGYCSGGLAAGEFANGDPEAWTIVDGKLYFVKTKEIRENWRKAPEAYNVIAEYNWEQNRDQLRDNY